MSCYVGSNNNRFYVALESTFGDVPAINSQNRIPGVKLAAKQIPETVVRRDKTGSRTFPGLPNQIRKNTTFLFTTFMTEWTNMTAPPSIGPLFQAAMGAAPVTFAGGTAASTTGTTGITFTAAHGLSVGQGLSYLGEIRFVAAV
jgi:hypothetical protein